MSVVAAVFLPLSLITGLFGVNLQGIIGANSPFGFIALSLALLILAVGLVALLRWLRWI
ncbi:MAG: CorA family divalent cation transporter [Sulfitobacter sp.]|nr:CorA family divalent cation transporter [Sulfitobacter sp.]